MVTTWRANCWLLLALTSFSITLVLLGLRRMQCTTNKYGRQRLPLQLEYLAESSVALTTEGLDPLPWQQDDAKTNMASDDQDLLFVHVMWCERSPFTFVHALTVLSAVKAMGASRVVLHTARPPMPDPRGYHTWLETLRKRLPLGVGMQPLGKDGCGDGETGRRKAAATILRKYGGLLIGDRTLITDHFRSKLHHSGLLAALTFDQGSNSFQGVVLARRTQDENVLQINLLQEIHDLEEGLPLPSSVSPPDLCVTSDKVRNTSSPACVIVQVSLRPRDIWHGDSWLQRQARSLLYGSDAEIQMQGTQLLSPRIGHVGWLGHRDLEPRHFLSVLSALHVAGLDHVIFHGDLQPQGELWQELTLHEAVTHLFAQKPVQAFGEPLPQGVHAERLLSLQTAAKYGGLALHPGVLWRRRLPDHLLSFDSVLSLLGDSDQTGALDWPDTVNLNLVVAKPGSQFLKAVFSDLHQDMHHDLHLDLQHVAYRTLEWRRHLVHVEPRLLVTCSVGDCSSELDADTLAILPHDWHDDHGPVWRSGGAHTAKAPWSNLTALDSESGPLPDLAKFILEKSGRSR